MMSLDSYNNLDRWPLKGLGKFLARCAVRKVSEINVTGTNTDPLLFKHTESLHGLLKHFIPDLRMGLRTNGVLFLQRPEIVSLYDKGSITICSLNPAIYQKMMGQGTVPDVNRIVQFAYKLGWNDIKANVVLGPENTCGLIPDVLHTIEGLKKAGFSKINLREPYGQPHVGNPLSYMKQSSTTLGMPTYDVDGCSVVYWDVHYVEVESVNLYASGHVSETYPITKGHNPVTGEVKDQSNFSHGRHRQQWQKSLPMI